MRIFFSSRRRHTRFDCDWSSDVCSSDLVNVSEGATIGRPAERNAEGRRKIKRLERLATFERGDGDAPRGVLDRKSTRLNSSHSQISYAVFCLKKKTQPRVH